MIKSCDCKQAAYIGQVVNMFVSQSSTDDYFMAVVFDGQSVKNVQWSTTAFATRCTVCGNGSECTIDASAELMASYRTFVNSQRIAEIADALHYGRETPSKGEGYVVVRGRKVAKGITGICSSVRFTQFGSMSCLQTVGGIVWVDSKNLAPVGV